MPTLAPIDRQHLSTTGRESNVRWMVTVPEGSEAPEELANKAIEAIMADTSILGDQATFEHDATRYSVRVTNSVPALGVFMDGGIMTYLEVRSIPFSLTYF